LYGATPHTCNFLLVLGWYHSLQDFIVLPTDIFRRCVISYSSVIYLPTSSPTDYVHRLSFRRWFPMPLLYQSEKQKNLLPMVLHTEFVRQKKSFPLEIYRRILYPLVNVSVSVCDTDRIYPYVNSSVSVAAIVKCRRIKSVGKAVGEWYCQIPTDSFRQ